MKIKYKNENGCEAVIEYVDMSMYELPNLLPSLWRLTITTNTGFYRNTYKTLRDAKIALGRYHVKFTEALKGE